jgi:hypothetical protein
MAVANTPAYYDTATIPVVKSFVVQARVSVLVIHLFLMSLTMRQNKLHSLDLESFYMLYKSEKDFPHSNSVAYFAASSVTKGISVLQALAPAACTIKLTRRNKTRSLLIE